MPTVSGLRKRVKRLQERRHASTATSGPEPLTPTECIAAVGAMRAYLGEYWREEGYTEPGRDAMLAYIDDGVTHLEMAGIDLARQI